MVDTTILVVDDKPANRLALEAVLDPLGVPIQQASSGAEAVEAILKHPDAIAVMLLDVQMPDLDGFETARMVKSRASTKHLPIIFITAVGREEAHIVKGYAHGAVDYVVKPFNADALRAKVSFFVDAHRRTVELERSRKVSQDTLALAIEAAELGVWGWDERSDWVVCDERCRSHLGASADQEIHLETLGMPAGDTLVAGQNLCSEHRTPAGRWIRVEARVFHDEANMRVVGLVRDLSEEKRGEAERELFLGVLGHDLRSPLQGITLAATVLTEHADPDVARIASRVGRNARQMTSLIADILDFVRVRGGTLHLNRSRTDLDELCGEVVDDAKAGAPGREIEFEPGGEASIMWDPDRIRQAVQNLVENAIRHGDPASPVRVAVHDDGPEVSVVVQNGGSPIPPEIRERIFDPFVSGQGGTGLGLFITKIVADAHGGQVAVDSADERTIVRLTLPR